MHAGKLKNPDLFLENSCCEILQSVNLGPVHICFRYRYPMHLFSEQVLGTYAFRLRDHWIVLGTMAFRFVIGTIHGLRSLTSMHYTAQRENSLVGMIDRLTLGHNARSPQLCTKPRPLEHVLGTTAFRLRFGGVLRGWFVPRTWFDHVPAGTVLAGTVPARTRSDYKKWCVPRTCSRNMFPLELYQEQVWTPGYSTGDTVVLKDDKVTNAQCL